MAAVSQIKKLFHIVITDIFYHFLQFFLTREIFASLYQASQVVAQYTAVKLVTGIAQKAAAVGKHSY
jgi:hypothetical protein